VETAASPIAAAASKNALGTPSARRDVVYPPKPTMTNRSKAT
jgi:hypothetical protein